MKLQHIIIACVCAMAAGCHDIEEWDNDPQGNFDALWTVVDQHYCFFSEKGIDWDACYQKYSQRVHPQMSTMMLFSLCTDMLAELKDGHVNLSSGFNTSYYTNWWSDYPQNYNDRLVREYYLGFDAPVMGGCRYAILPQNVGYVSYPSFSYILGEGNIDVILSTFALCKGLIIDIRNNGGGDVTMSQRWASRFITERTLAGYMMNKTGPGHDDFSEPFEQYIEPAGDGHILWEKPVIVLTNRSTFSAANDFVSIMQYAPNARIVGARTGGGCGMPINLDIPNGWKLRLSSVLMLDARGLSTEYGIDPSPGCAVDLDPLLALLGTDTMIDRAISLLTN